MEAYVALLRGINVSGKNKVPMNELKAMFNELGFEKVSTYIQSGNVLFECEVADLQFLARKIEQKILEVFGFEISVLIRTPAALQEVVAANPFAEESGIEPKHLYVTFLSHTPEQALLDKLHALSLEPEQFRVTGKEVFFYCPTGYGKTKLDNNFFEKKLKVRATTRNWKTVNVLAGR